MRFNKAVEHKLVRMNYLGQYECIICATRHTDARSLELHLQGKKHAAKLKQLSLEGQETDEKVARSYFRDVLHPTLPITGVEGVIEIPAQCKITHTIMEREKETLVVFSFNCDLIGSSFKPIAIRLSPGKLVNQEARREGNVFLFQAFCEKR